MSTLGLLKAGMPYFTFGADQQLRSYALAELLQGDSAMGIEVAIPRTSHLMRVLGRGRLRRTIRNFPSWGEFIWEQVPELKKLKPPYIEQLLVAIVGSSREGYCNLTQFAQSAHISRNKAAEIMRWLEKAGVWIPIRPFPYVSSVTAQRTRCHGVFFDSGLIGELISMGKDQLTGQNAHNDQIFRTAVISDLIANLSRDFDDFEFWYFQRNQTIVDLIFKVSGSYHALVINPSSASGVRSPHFLWNLESGYANNLNWGDAFMINFSAQLRPLGLKYFRGWEIPFDAYCARAEKCSELPRTHT